MSWEREGGVSRREVYCGAHDLWFWGHGDQSLRLCTSTCELYDLGHFSYFFLNCEME